MRGASSTELTNLGEISQHIRQARRAAGWSLGPISLRHNQRLEAKLRTPLAGQRLPGSHQINSAPQVPCGGGPNPQKGPLEYTSSCVSLTYRMNKNKNTSQKCYRPHHTIVNRDSIRQRKSNESDISQNQEKGKQSQQSTHLHVFVRRPAKQSSSPFLEEHSSKQGVT